MHVLNDLVNSILVNEMLNNLCALFFSKLINLFQEDHQRVQIEQLQDAFTVLRDTFQQNVMNLGITLT